MNGNEVTSWYISLIVGQNIGLKMMDFKILDLKILKCNEWKWGHQLVHISDCGAKYWIRNDGFQYTGFQNTGMQ